MRKIVVHKAGGYDRLCVEHAPTPSPGAGEVLLEVTAAGVNYADVVVRMGLYASAKKYVGWPITPGFEVAGRVAAVGEGVEELELDQPVLAVTRFGGYASHVVVPALQASPYPDALTPEQAAALPTVFFTAYYALFELARPREGGAILVHSAAGGVGGALLQLSRLAGCRGVGVVGAAHKTEVARTLGADVVIDKSREPLWPAARRASQEGYDAVFDANGASTLRGSYDHLRPTGRLVVYGFHSMLPRQGGKPSWPKLIFDWLRTPRFDPMKLTSDNRSVMGFNLSYLFEHADLMVGMRRRLLDWFASGELTPPPVRTYPLERVAEAHRELESGQTVGKLVLTL